ncbi:MAG: hypothetical protein OQK82_02795 [Candidatus Pacearchaeota archaeon]|nr:hypothetical protein [Candidatus Pacearchaeota archaeon]
MTDTKEKYLQYNLGRVLRVLTSVSLPEIGSLLGEEAPSDESLLKARFNHAKANKGHEGSCFEDDIKLGKLFLEDRRESLDKAFELLMAAKEELE